MNLTRFCVLLAIVPTLMFLGIGCGGFSGSHSVSPMNFLLPGLIQNEKPQEKTAPIAAVPQPGETQTVSQSL